jgi:hypothetical protein
LTFIHHGVGCDLPTAADIREFVLTGFATSRLLSVPTLIQVASFTLSLRRAFMYQRSNNWCGRKGERTDG